MVLAQFHVGADKAVNIRRAEKAIEDTLDAELVVRTITIKDDSLQVLI